MAMPSPSRAVVALLIAGIGAADALHIGAVPSTRVSSASRRVAASPVCSLPRRTVLRLAAFAVVSAAKSTRTWADTMPEMEGTMKGFDEDEIKRAEFQKKQKAYKKAWRKELANLEYSTTDDEAMNAIKALNKMVRANGNEIPEGVRKMDLDQVYKRVKGNLSKDVRLAFIDLDRLVGSAVTVKDLRGFDE